MLPELLVGQAWADRCCFGLVTGPGQAGSSQLASCECALPGVCVCVCACVCVGVGYFVGFDTIVSFDTLCV